MVFGLHSVLDHPPEAGMDGMGKVLFGDVTHISHECIPSSLRFGRAILPNST